MKKSKLFFVFLILSLIFLSGCSKKRNASGNLVVDSMALDKVVFEKDRGDCLETMAIYFKGDNVTKVETKETYSDPDNLLKAYETYSESSDYDNLRSSGLDIGYEYSDAHMYNFIDGIVGKNNIINTCQTDKGYTLK